MGYEGIICTYLMRVCIYIMIIIIKVLANAIVFFLLLQNQNIYLIVKKSFESRLCLFAVLKPNLSILKEAINVKTENNFCQLKSLIGHSEG